MIKFIVILLVVFITALVCVFVTPINPPAGTIMAFIGGILCERLRMVLL